MRSAIAVHTTAQERERKLMNVLAARRSALHRGGFRRVGTTGRTATSTASLETTSKTPPDPRSICIRNCTKNFTRRTTASCMRQCANFTKLPLEVNGNNETKTGAIIFRPSSKNGTNNQVGLERDTNEILFTDESSHGLFVVAKEQNGTVNHIPDAVKGLGKNRSRQKPTVIASAAAMILNPPTSIEDDDLQPYLFFGQKLPPLKPAMLTITSVSDDHPRLLEVAVSQPLSTTTPATVVNITSTLSAVERSRSRYKYNHVRSGTIPFNRRFTGSGRPTTSIIDNNVANMSRVIVNATLASEGSLTETTGVANITGNMRENVTITPRFGAIVKEENLLIKTTIKPTTLGSEMSNTPLFIQVLSEEEEIPTTVASTTTTTTTTTKQTPVPTIMTRTWTTSTRMMTTSTTPKPTVITTKYNTKITTTTTTTKTPKTTTTTSTSTITPKIKSIIEEDTEKLRAMAPTLTQEIKTDEKTNLIIFINRTSDMGFERDGLKSTVTTKRPRTSTDSYSTILRTTVLSSVRSTVNPPLQSVTIKANTTADGVYVGLVETDKSGSQQNGGEISSTVIANEPDVTQEMRRMNIATIVLACIGIFPLVAVIIYLMRNFVLRRSVKDDEDFDVCITDQQPISPVKKLDGKYHHEQEDDDEEEHNMHHMHHNGGQSKVNKRERYDEQCSVTSQSDQEFDRSNIRLKSLLGEGNFGQVWKAEADDLSGHIGTTRIVAVKTIRACSAQLSLKDEANIMRKLGSHLNVVTLLGACVESEPHMLIMEYAMRGRLLSLLRAARSASNILPASVPGGRSLTPLSPRTMAGFALDIACGMEYIAEKRIVHRDLAARNVLLDHNGVCKICDFGMSLDLDAERRRKEQEKNINNEIMRSNSNKFKFDFGSRFIINQWSQNFPSNVNNHSGGQQHKTTDNNEKRSHSHGNGQNDTFSKRHALPIRWMAPEALQYHIFTTETDVWAFGIVLWEIANLGSTPYSQLTGREVIRRVPNGLRPEIPKEGRRDFYNLMVRCWHKEPQMRPSFTQCRLEISRSLHKYVDDESASSDYMDVSGFSEDLEHGMVYFNHRISEFECEI